MADLVHNRAKGRMAEWAERVNANDPANSALAIAPFNNDGSSTDDNVRDADSVAAIEALTGVTERTTNGWTRKTLTDTDGITVTYDDTNDRVDVDIPDQTWTAVGAGGGATTDLEIAYDADTTAGTDANILPGTWHDFAVTPDGSDVTAQIATGGFYRAS
jgi:hypothetical protein